MPCQSCQNPTLCTDRCQRYAEELAACEASGQMTPEQAAAHVEAGEMPPCTDWSKVPHDQWPKKCPKCGAGLSYTSYEPYCAYEDCRWNNKPAASVQSGGEAGEMEAAKGDRK